VAKKKSTYSPPIDKKPQLPRALTSNQQKLIDSVFKKDLVLALGSAGTGKTYLSACLAAYFYSLGKIDRIILTRPTVSTGKSIGFFPGTLDEKMEPWVVPFMSVLETVLTKGKVELMRKSGLIQVIPFEVIRGRSWDNSFVILDEAQNCTLTELKAFVTRHGEGSTAIINGDVTQSDLDSSKPLGLKILIDIIKTSKDLQDHTEVVTFTSSDIVRSGICKAWVEAFEACSF